MTSIRTPRLPEPAPAGLVRRALAWLQAAHAFPLIMVLALTALIGAASSDGDIDAGRIALLVLAMLGSQLAIGWTNDYRDRESDRVFQPSKPVPSGLVPAPWLPWAALIAVCASLAIGVTLGLAPLAFLVIGTAAGIVYDLGVKDTKLSWLPYLVAFAVLPPFVWTALGVFRDDFLWLYAVGAPLAVAGHIANVLPDLDTDAASGRTSVAVTLGRRRSLMLLGACVVAPGLLLLVTLPFVEYQWTILAATLVGFSVLVLGAALAYRGLPDRRAAVTGFRCVVVAAVGFATGWLAAVA
ncbi:MAG TPA: UbiA family prenyltransferase [Dehalococcoidia bacterium]|nr:UbiA family prenyltransferase [Dehalococcoidia bacterium]